LQIENFFLSPIYTTGSFFLAVAVFFLVPLPWYLALLAAIATYFVTLIPSTIVMVRQNAALDAFLDEYNESKQSGSDLD
jgi:hypothetical protein